MNTNKDLKRSRYIFAAGAVLHVIIFALGKVIALGRFSDLYLVSGGLMIYGLYANLKAKGLRPFKKKRFYFTVFLGLWPFFLPLAPMCTMYGTGEQGKPVPKWRTFLVRDWMALIYFLLLCITLYPEMYSFRVAVSRSDLKEAQRHLSVAKSAETADLFRKELDEASSTLSSVRKHALTDKNSSLYIRTFLGGIIKESDLDLLEADIKAAKENGPKRK